MASSDSRSRSTVYRSDYASNASPELRQTGPTSRSQDGMTSEANMAELSWIKPFILNQEYDWTTVDVIEEEPPETEPPGVSPQNSNQGLLPSRASKATTEVALRSSEGAKSTPGISSAAAVDPFLSRSAAGAKPTELFPRQSLCRLPWYCFGQFADPAVEEEFTRFEFRELTPAAIGVLLGMVIISWSATHQVAMEKEGLGILIALFVVGGIVLAIATVDVVVFVLFPHTLCWCRVRMALVCGFVTFGAIFPPLALLYSGNEETTSVIEPWNFLLILIVLVSSTLKPLPYLLILLANGIFMIGVLLSFAPSPQILLHILLNVAALITSAIVGILNDQTLRVQFQQSVLLERNARLAVSRQEEVETLLCEMVPQSALTRLLEGTIPWQIDQSPDCSVLFADVVNFTKWSSVNSARTVAAMLNSLYIEFDKAAVTHSMEKIKTIGDAYWAVCGIPDARADHADKASDFALCQLRIVDRQNDINPSWKGIEVRIGIHSGPLAGGVIGEAHQIGYEVFGLTTTVAEEVQKKALPGYILITDATAALIQRDIDRDFPAQQISVPPNNELITAYALQDPHRRKKDSRPSGMSTPISPKQSLTKTPQTQKQDRRNTTEANILTARKKSSASTNQSGSFSSGSGSFGNSGVLNSADFLGVRGSVAKRRGNGTLQELARRRSTAVFDIPGGFDGRSNADARPASSMSARSTTLRTNFRTNFQFGRRHSIQSAFSVVSDTIEDEEDDEEARAPRKDEEMTVIGFQTEEEDRARRAMFVAKRAEKRGALMPNLQEIRDLLHRLRERRYQFIELAFISDGVELDYQAFASERRTWIRRAIRPINIVLALLVLIWSSIGHHLASSLLAAFVVLLFGCVSITSFFNFHRWQPLLEGAFSLLAAILLVVALGVEPHEFFARNAMWLCTFVQLTVLNPAAGNVSAWILSVSYALFVAPTAIGFSVALSTSFGLEEQELIIFLVFSIPVAAILFFVSEKRLREEFLEQRAASYYASIRESQISVQEAMLDSMVPPFIISSLMSWLDVDLDPQQSIVKDYKSLVVCFVQFSPEPVLPTKKSEDSPFANTWPGLNRESGNDNFSSAKDLATWVIETQKKAEAHIEHFAAITKIKTIGDVVLLAGPFTEDHSVEDAAEGMVRCTFTLSQIARVKSGTHVGPVVGGIMGTSRLTFDIFGDAVNTASRVMSGSDEGQKCVTEELIQYLAYDFVDHSGPGLIDLHPRETMSMTITGPGDDDDEDEVMNLISGAGTGKRDSSVGSASFPPRSIESFPSTAAARELKRRSTDSRVSEAESAIPTLQGRVRLGPRIDRDAKGKGVISVRESFPPIRSEPVINCW